MTRIDLTFRSLKDKGKKAFIPYVTGGDPDMAASKHIIEVLAASGADIIEIGIPFSDPMADGPTIQRAIVRSLDAGATCHKIFNMVRELRKHIRTPFVFMTYYNIVYNYGAGKFVSDAKKCGADGIIVPDLPMEESGYLSGIADKEDFSVILLAAPTTGSERFKKIAAESRSFIYYVSLTGVTGSRKSLDNKLFHDMKTLKTLTVKPICVGFGISNPDQAGKVAVLSDGVVVGSAIISVIEKNIHNKTHMLGEVGRFASSLARAIHNA